MSEIKNYVSRISKQSYWHCVLDDHGSVDVSTRGTTYMKFRIKGVREKYDKDFVLFSKQGQREFMLRGKKMQILSFLAMLMIFVAVIQCPDESTEGMCLYKNQMMMGGAAIMMGLMGMRVANRNKSKKRMEEHVRRQQAA